MGCTSSSDHRRSSDMQPAIINRVRTSNEEVRVHSEQSYDERAIAAMRRDFQNMEYFILNNMLLSVMFFEDFEREMQRIGKNGSKKEKEMSLKLMKDHKKQIIMPDIVFENVNQMVRFSPKHGRIELQMGNKIKKYVEDPIITQRMYIIHDMVEIQKESEDLDHYIGIDKPTVKANIVNSQHSGYVKLKQVENVNSMARRSKRSSESSSFGQGTSGYNERSAAKYDSMQPSTSYANDYSDRYSDNSDEEYDYIRINESRMQRPLSFVDRDRNNSGGLPPECLRPIQEKNVIESDNEDDSEIDNRYLTRHYIDSGVFMEHFTEAFPGSLGESLGFQLDEMRLATFNSAAIYCDTTDDFGRTVQYEIIPAVLNPWSDLSEWMRRNRPMVIDRQTTTIYQWPTENMIDEIHKLHSVVIPRGFIPKRGTNLEGPLEWEISYPNAEKYMMTRMSHAQMKCFLFMVVMFKTFIEPLTGDNGIQIDHFRTLMFHECEKNFRDWVENRLGSKLMAVLKNFIQDLGRQHLRDYFVESKNVFENIPSRFLIKAQEKLHSILEMPVVHFLLALRNVKYTSTQFYPALDIDTLYKILREDAIKTINPILFSTIEEDMEAQRSKRKLDPGQRWEKKNTEILLKKHQEFKNKSKEGETEKRNVQRLSTDSIDLKWSCQKNVRNIKALNVIVFFIKHFLNMADFSTKYSMQQAQFYLKHAWYLTKVMETEIPSAAIRVPELQMDIKHREEQCKRRSTLEQSSSMRVQDPVPHVPNRNSTHIPKEIVLKKNTIDIQNVSLAYQKGIQKNGQAPTIKNKSSMAIAGPSTTTTNWVEMNNNATRRNTKTIKWNT